MNIHVNQMRLLNDDKPLKAFCDVQVNGWLIRDWRIIQQEGQRVYVMPPQVSWRDPDSGEIKYKGILTIPAEEKQEIDIAILYTFQREKEKQNGSNSSRD